MQKLSELGPVPDISEIAEVVLLDHIPDNPTHPDIQPYLFKKTLEYIKNRKERLDIFEAYFFQPFFLKQPGNPFYNSSPDLKFDRKIWILVGNIDPCSYYEVNLITFH